MFAFFLGRHIVVCNYSSVASGMIFVGGLQRSGTTLLGRLLAEHGQIAGIVNSGSSEDEGQFLQDVYLTDHEMGAQMHPERLSAAGRIVRWAYHPRAHLTERDAEGIPDAADRLEAAWRDHWSKPRAAWRVEKSPSNVMRTRFLQAVYPDARFVIITRHPIAQALAIRKWATRRARFGVGFGALIDHWLTAMECYAADEPHLRYAYRIRYEDLTADPAGALAAVFRFVGVDAAVVDTSHVRDQNGRYFDYWQQFTRPPRAALLPDLGGTLPTRLAERGAAQLLGRRVEKAVAPYAARMAAFGYELPVPVDALLPRVRSSTP